MWDDNLQGLAIQLWCDAERDFFLCSRRSHSLTTWLEVAELDYTCLSLTSSSRPWRPRNAQTTAATEPHGLNGAEM